LGNSPNLDALRSFAVLLVLTNHAIETFAAALGERTIPVAVSYDIGRMGVLLFFVHTACVLFASLERMQGSGWPLARAFYLRRAFRIFPLAIVCVCAAVSFRIPERAWVEYEAPGMGALVSNLFLTTNLTETKPVFGVLWTLPVELQLYLFLPVVFLFTRRAQDLKNLVLLCAFALLAAWVLPLLSARLNAATYAPCFMAGIVAYALHARIAPRMPGAMWLPFLLVVACLYVAVGKREPGLQQVLLQTAICFAIAAGFITFREIGATWMNRITHVVARYSYGIYLFHMIAIWLGFFELQRNSALAGSLLTLALMIAFAVAGYHLIEAPAIAWSRRTAEAMNTRRGM
jgi:peptidoglycan/LPS O-acetylase OafA/YrhL